MRKKIRCTYFLNQITKDSPTHYNCGCRKTPSPVSVSVDYIYSHDRYKEALEAITLRVDLQKDNITEQELMSILKEVSDISKEALNNQKTE